MKKIKELWTNNRIVFVLICILVVCFIAIVVVASTFFIAGNKSSYGDRLNNIEEHPVTDEFKTSYEEKVKENKSVSNVGVRVSGRIIYVTVTFVKDTKLDDAKNVAAKSLDLFTENISEYYDISFIIKSENSKEDGGFVLMGARNVNGTELTWNNNTEVEESETK